MGNLLTPMDHGWLTKTSFISELPRAKICSTASFIRDSSVTCIKIISSFLEGIISFVRYDQIPQTVRWILNYFASLLRKLIMSKNLENYFSHEHGMTLWWLLFLVRLDLYLADNQLTICYVASWFCLIRLLGFI